MPEPPPVYPPVNQPALDPRRTAFGVLSLCFVLGFAARGLMESFLVFLLPLTAEFGGDRAAITSIYSGAMLASGLGAPLAGFLFDRLGPRWLYTLGLIGLGSGLMLAGLASKIWHLQLSLGIGLGFGVAALGNVPNSALINRWFLTRQSLVSSLIFSSLGFGILLLVPLSEILIQAFGWRNTYLTWGGVAFFILIIILPLPWRRIAAGHPALHGEAQKRGGATRLWTARRVIRTPAFWGLFSVFFFTSQAMFAITPQAVAYLVENGFTPLEAASAWGFTGILMPLGMLTFGWLDDRIGRRTSVTLSYGMTVLAIASMWLIGRYPNVIWLASFIFFMGSSLGSRGPLVASLSMRIFRGPNAGAIFGSISLAGGLGSALGSTWGGWLHDLSGGYDLVMLGSLICVIFGCLPFWTIKALKQDG